MIYNSYLHRSSNLFDDDINLKINLIQAEIENSTFLVIGGGGSIGSAIVKEIFNRNPKVLHVIDINENSLVELVRDLRSSIGYKCNDFQTFTIDAGSEIFNLYANKYKSFDYILNLSALKHVRNERDPFTLMRMINVNIINTINIIKKIDCKKRYFVVSTDKAAEPVNVMGATKLLMEKFLLCNSENISISMARFANVIFSQGSLLDGFKYRIEKIQPLSAPKNISRYFITDNEAGKLCLLATLFGRNGEIYIPKVKLLKPILFTDLAVQFLRNNSYEPYLCANEDDARNKIFHLIKSKKWPCYFFDSSTTGEKELEIFHTADDSVYDYKYNSIDIIRSKVNFIDFNKFLFDFNLLKADKEINKNKILGLIKKYTPEFNHFEKNNYLENRM